MTVSQIIDQVRELDKGEFLTLRRVLDELADTRPASAGRQPMHTVPVDMGTPLVDVNKALHAASALDDQAVIEHMGHRR